MGTNDHIFNDSGTNNLIYSQVTNTIASPSAVAPPSYSASLAGNVFSAFTSNSASLGLLGGSVVTSLRMNNTSATKSAYIIRLAGGVGVALNLLSSLSASYSIINGGSLTSPSGVTAINNNLGSSNTSMMSMTSSTSAVSGGTVMITTPVVGGPFIIDFDGAIIIPPSSSLSLSMSASLSVAGVLSVQTSAFWWEA
ncbi:hypothetical protein [Paenibacillus sp. 1001270B_150601_E10]|uniref:hypothetical protein n=1 Tax=Paenibacillus sp. 1001270B_150601_E10 TaxID=2787079 RepID=UPI0018A0E93E|nr:hypothetical protein [Paenibacillus sp. 1001270B_150601_E10]